MDLFKNITVLSLEQATVLPYLTFRLAQDGMQVYIETEIGRVKLGQPVPESNLSRELKSGSPETIST